MFHYHHFSFNFTVFMLFLCSAAALLLNSLPSDAAPIGSGIGVTSMLEASKQLIHAFETTAGHFLAKRDAYAYATNDKNAPSPSSDKQWNIMLYVMIFYLVITVIFYVITSFLVQRVKYQLVKQVETIGIEKTKTSSSVEQMKTSSTSSIKNEKPGKVAATSSIQVTLTSARPEGIVERAISPMFESLKEQEAKESDQPKTKSTESSRTARSARQKKPQIKYFEEEDSTQELLTGSIRDAIVERVDTAFTLSTGDLAPFPASYRESSSRASTSRSTTSSSSTSSFSYSATSDATSLSSFSSPSESSSSGSSTLTAGSSYSSTSSTSSRTGTSSRSSAF